MNTLIHIWRCEDGHDVIDKVVNGIHTTKKVVSGTRVLML